MAVVGTVSRKRGPTAGALGNEAVRSLGDAGPVLPGGRGCEEEESFKLTLTLKGCVCIHDNNNQKEGLNVSVLVHSDSPCPSSGSELVVLPSLSPDSSDPSEELPQRTSSLASKYSAAESATEGGPWEEPLTAG